MFISDIEAKYNQHLPVKTAIMYLYASILCIVITNIYALFGHGVRSYNMDFMFLHPLLGGTVIFLLISFVLPRLPEKLRKTSRVGYNLYNSGIASLTSAKMLAGIMEIARTGSKCIQYIKITGIVLLVVGILCQGTEFLKRNN